MPSSTLRAAALALVAMGVSSHAFAQVPPAARSPSRAATTSLHIFTVPAGLRVHVARDTAAAASDTGAGQDVPIGPRHPAVTDASLRGVSPLLVRDLAPGRYLVAVSPVELLDRNLNASGTHDPLTRLGRSGTAGPSLKLRAFVSFTPLPTLADRPPLPNPITGAVVYSTTLPRPGTHRLVIFASASHTLAALDSIYPAGRAFQFDTTAFLAELDRRAGTLFSAEEKQQLIDLLRRGGRVFVRRGDIRLGAVIGPTGAAEVDLQLRMPTQ